MIRKFVLGLAVLAALGAGGASAAEKGTHDKPAIRPAGTGQQKQIDKLASEFSVTKEEVTSLRDKGLGWGEVRHALSLSQKTGKPVGDIMKMREDGMGWGAIAKKEGVKLDGVDKGARAKETPVRGPEPKSSERKGDHGMMGGDRGNRKSK